MFIQQITDFNKHMNYLNRESNDLSYTFLVVVDNYV